MIIKRVSLTNFRCFDSETIDLERYSCFVGRNNAGKSTILKSIDYFFDSSPRRTRITADDFHDKSKELRINITFGELSAAAQAEFAHYYRSNELTFYIKSRINNGNIETSAHGIRYTMDAFSPFFEAGTAADKKAFYQHIKAQYGFPDYTNKDAAESVIRRYEEAHPEKCAPKESADDAFGAIGPVVLIRKYVDWIYVPAVKDAAQEQTEIKNSAFGKLIQRAVRSKLDLTAELAKISADARERVSALVKSRGERLRSLSDQLDLDFKALTSLRVDVKLDWSATDDETVVVSEPFVRSTLDDGGYSGEVSRFGHGLQRNYLIALLQLNAKLSEGAQPP